MGDFIVFEGIDGSGKSTQLNLLLETLENNGVKVKLLKQPTNGKIGKIIREKLSASEVDNNEMIELFANDRLEMIQEKNGVLDLIKDGYTIICDRGYLSSIAYQSQNGDFTKVIDANLIYNQLLDISLTIFLDIKPSLALDRINSRGENIEIYENIERLSEVYNNYIAYSKIDETQNIVFVDATLEQELVHNDIMVHINRLLNKSKRR